MPRRSTVPQTLLLILTALGVAGMHTMGHIGAGHGMLAMRAEPNTATAPIVDSMAVAVQSVALPRMAVPHPGGSPDPTQMCLAVLTLVDSAFLIASALLAVGRLALYGTALQAVFAASGRDPPCRPPVGLLIADLSVLRT